MVRVTEAWLRENYPDADKVLGAPASRPRRRDLSAIVACKPGRWEVAIDDWMPASKNLKHGRKWRWHKARIGDNQIVAHYLSLGGVPKAWCRRLAALTVIKRSNRRGARDGQNFEESFYDSLVCGGFLIDDKPEWLARRVTEIVVDRALEVEVRSVVVIEDLPGAEISSK